MRFGLRRRTAPVQQPLLSVVVPAYQVQDYLPQCLDSLLSSTHPVLDVVVVDDGSTDRTGAIADDYARRDDRIRVVHTENHGLGAARNEGLRHTFGELIAFADSDDIVPPTAYAAMVASLAGSGSDFVTGSIVRMEADDLVEPPWMRRLHRPARTGIRIEDHPELLGDVFAWNKVFRRSWWDAQRLTWPEGIRYEDQPTTTLAYLHGRIDVLPDIVYHWRIRADGSSITQQRDSLADLTDRFTTKRMALTSVAAYGSATVRSTFLDRVLPGDLWRYFDAIPGCTDEWWQSLRGLVTEFWGDRHSLLHSGLPPVYRLTGWLVEKNRRTDATAVMTYRRRMADAPIPRRDDGARQLLDLPHPVLPADSVPAEALLVRPGE